MYKAVYVANSANIPSNVRKSHFNNEMTLLFPNIIHYCAIFRNAVQKSLVGATFAWCMPSLTYFRHKLFQRSVNMRHIYGIIILIFIALRILKSIFLIKEFTLTVMWLMCTKMCGYKYNLLSHLNLPKIEMGFVSQYNIVNRDFNY